jgi:hypothetical protein
MRHVLAPTGEDPEIKGEIRGGRVMVAAGTVIDPVFLQSINRIAGKRLTNDTEEKAREVPWSKT